MQQWWHFSPKERFYIGELDKFLLNIKLSSIEAKAEKEGGEQIFLEQKIVFLEQKIVFLPLTEAKAEKEGGEQIFLEQEIVFLPLTEAKAEKEGGVKRLLPIAAAAASLFKSTKSFQV